MLSKILTYLDIKSLKTSRLVNKFWEEEATPQLKTRAVTIIDFWNDDLVDMPFPYTPRRVSDYLDFPFVCQNIHVIHNITSKDPQLAPFVKRFGHQIKKLVIDSAKYLNIWLQHSPNLTFVKVQKAGRGRQFPKNGSPYLQIQHLVFRLSYAQYSNFTPEAMITAAGLIEYFRNLSSLCIHEDDWMCEGKLIEETLKAVALNPTWSPNLQHLDIRSRKNSCTKIQLFINLTKRRWTTLRMGRVLLEEANDIKEFHDLLNYHSATLTQLEFQLAASGFSTDTDETILPFPILPKLRSLDMQFCTGAPKIKPFQYSDLFPVLQHVGYTHKEVFCRPTLWQTLFPVTGQVCRTVKTLHIELDGVELDEVLPNLSNLFPNSCHIEKTKERL